MKKIVIVSLVVISALVVLGVGTVFAQGGQPPQGPVGMMGSGQEGPLHEYMIQALAKAMGIDATQLETRIDGGETPYQVAISLGIAADKIPALLAAARTSALDSAVSAGVISQQQADFMKSRGFGGGRGMGTGACSGMGGTGVQRGWRWQQTNP
jgi:hypothetical protein